MSTNVLHQIKEEVEESDEDMDQGKHPLLFDQMDFKGYYTTDTFFKKAHPGEKRSAMATNEKELFPDRVPIIIERCNKEEGC